MADTHIHLPKVIVLAGGLGTRLRSVVRDLPKPMATVNGKPFLHYVLQYLSKQGAADVILSVGYKADTIERYFGDHYLGLHIVYSKEEEPLGTGGAIKQAFKQAGSEALVLNGDTYFDVSLSDLYADFKNSRAHAVLAAKSMTDFDRYGTLVVGPDNRILKFEEKKPLRHGLINGGIYAVDKTILDSADAGYKFSFEKDVLEKQVSSLHLRAFQSNGFFIDIGIPEDYRKAQDVFK